MQILKNKTDLVVFILGLFITIICILLFKPISESGDAPVYLKYAQVIAECGDTSAFIHKSPAYPWFLSLMISIFGSNNAIRITVIIQFLLLFISGMIIYKIFNNNIFKSKIPAILATFLIYTNLSAIFYSYMILTETLTLFLLTILLWFIIKGLNRSSRINFFIVGLLFSIMVLARFNTLPMIFVITGIIFLFQIWKPESKRIIIRNFIFFLIPVIILLNGYAFSNFIKHDFYGLFPSGGSILVSRNALITTIDGTEKVSGRNLQVLEIFNHAKRNLKINNVDYKGSLTRFDKLNVMDKLYNGYLAYFSAEPELYKYFKINPEKPEPELSMKLEPFYKEISKINKGKIWGLKFFSLLNSFRSSTGLIKPEKNAINLYKLPSWIIQMYKLTFFVLSVFVFSSSIVYLILLMSKSIKPDNIIIIFIFTVFGFFFINFAFATVGDANRFKYPVEPLIISLGVYYIYTGYIFIKSSVKHLKGI